MLPAWHSTDRLCWKSPLLSATCTPHAPPGAMASAADGSAVGGGGNGGGGGGSVAPCALPPDSASLFSACGGPLTGGAMHAMPTGACPQARVLPREASQQGPALPCRTPPSLQPNPTGLELWPKTGRVHTTHENAGAHDTARQPAPCAHGVQCPDPTTVPCAHVVLAHSARGTTSFLAWDTAWTPFVCARKQISQPELIVRESS